MTTPTMPAGIQHAADPLAPQPFGLYSVATPIDLDPPARLLGGVDWIPANCGPSGIWEHDICPEPVPEPEDAKTGDRPDDDHFPKVTVWATDDCSLYATTVEENQERAVQLLRLHEPLWVERHVAALLAARATALPAESTVQGAVGALEEALGAHGFSGVLHARRGMAAIAAGHQLTVPEGARLVTPLSNAWVFGGGYSIGDTMYVTGPLTVWRNTISTRTAVDAETNTRQVVAERVIAVGWECPGVVYSVQVS